VTRAAAAIPDWPRGRVHREQIDRNAPFRAQPPGPDMARAHGARFAIEHAPALFVAGEPGVHVAREHARAHDVVEAQAKFG